MNYAYAQKRRTPAQTGTQTGGGAAETAVPNSARLAALEAGQIAPTAADKGHRVDLPEAQRRKMESSFGMDFSNVKLYESEVLGQTGAEAMAQGNEIAFAPGKFDLASQEGQARLGHELSHVASQARGQVHGNGFLLDHSLEARADREGAMAARGESVYGGAVAPLSAASAAPMAGPMQAKKPENYTPEERQAQASKDADELFQLENGLKTDLSDRQRKKISKRYDKILDRGTNVELLRELQKRRKGHGEALYEKYGMDKSDPNYSHESMRNSRNFFGGWDNHAMDMGTYGQLISVVGGNGQKGMDAYMQFLEEQNQAERSKTEEEKEKDQEINRLYLGTTNNPLMKTEYGERLSSEYESNQTKRANNIYQNKKTDNGWYIGTGAKGPEHHQNKKKKLNMLYE